MKTSQAVGFSLIGQAYIGLIVFAVVLAVSLIFSFNLTVVLYGAIFGAITAALLLCYWLGKGGSFFLLAVMCPLICIIVTPITSFLEIANVLGAFFVGLCLLLTGYRLKKGS
ncbi:hypothetical protein [Pseudoalteromonas sp. MMG024]|uniref:hypothetical protein n=1 Tax=Pseudoalteromonas sp. MMG024 TaxID=2909980 RepID=UPI001F3806C4|nr:hypothetical protein [Pseudoalteromonas sp. MMG024]MCF6458235.1 hypothetical protein [Pseudoalteromonas sp. MMG024]